MRTHLSADFARFLVAGAVNTALTSAIYFLGLLALSPTVAYAIAWLVGIGFVMVVYPDRVFVGSTATAARRAALGMTIAAVFFAGEVILSVVVSTTGRADVAFAVTLGVTFLLNFALSRLLIRT